MIQSHHSEWLNCRVGVAVGIAAMLVDGLWQADDIANIVRDVHHATQHWMNN